MGRRDATLHFISGRLASGKTTLALRLAEQEGAVLICEDVWLSKLSDGISSFEDYLKWSRRCRSVIGPLVIQTLRAGTSVVLDFAGNTPAERKWVRSLFEEAEAKHVLHYLDIPEGECLARLKVRNETKPEGLFFATTSGSRVHRYIPLVPAADLGRGLPRFSQIVGAKLSRVATTPYQLTITADALNETPLQPTARPFRHS